MPSSQVHQNGTTDFHFKILWKALNCMVSTWEPGFDWSQQRAWISWKGQRDEGGWMRSYPPHGECSWQKHCRWLRLSLCTREGHTSHCKAMKRVSHRLANQLPSYHGDAQSGMMSAKQIKYFKYLWSFMKDMDLPTRAGVA